MWSTRYSFHRLKKLRFPRQIWEKYSNTKFHENHSGRSWVIPCGQTDRQNPYANSEAKQIVNCERGLFNSHHCRFISAYVMALNLLPVSLIRQNRICVRPTVFFLNACLVYSVLQAYQAQDQTFVAGTNLNPSKTKCRLLYLKTQFVPRSKHFSSRL